VKTLRITVVAALLAAAAAFALPADLVVISAREVRPDEAGGLYYLGQAAGGYMYNGSSAAVGRVAPYRVLDRDARAKDYYIVWAPDWVGVTAEAFAHLGTSVRLSEYEILVGLERGFGPGELRAVEHRIELIKLEPVTPVDWRYEGEAPPKKKDPRIEGAINTMTAEEYAGYIKRLQDFKTRCTDTTGCDAARDYLCDFFAAQNLDARLFPFHGVGFGCGSYPQAPDYIYVATLSGTIKRTRSAGTTWDTIMIERTCEVAAWDWINAAIGCVAGYNSMFARTVDGGDTWDVYKIHEGYPLELYSPADLCFVNSQIGWIAGTFWPSVGGTRGCVFRTLDGGRTWDERPIPDGFVPYFIRFSDVDHGWMGGERTASCIYYTDDGGATWRECSQPGERVMRDLAVVGPAEAWATDYTDKLLHTTDGTTWLYVTPGLNYKYECIEFPDAKHGFAADDALIATDDGGATWHEVVQAPKIEYWILAFADNVNGVVGDIGGEHLYKTDDGGKTFASIVDGMDRTAENVVAERRGERNPEEIVIIGGHFDSISDCKPSFCPGAEDNASGTACAMAAARAFRNLSFNRTVRYVAFGDEEGGMGGSEAYAKYCASRGEKVVGVLNADMVSYDEDMGGRDDFSVAHKGDEYRWLYNYLTGVGRLYGNKLLYDSHFWISDHWRFWNAGYPAIGVIEGGIGPGGVMEYPYYHTTEDTLDKLHPDLGVRFVRDYAAMFAHLAGVSDVGVNEPRPGGAAVPFARAFAVYPNPYCYATCAGGVNFVGLKTPARVEVYDLAGRRVAREEVAAGCDACVWRPAGVGGEALSPGVYLYRVEGQGQREAGKVVVAR
jgi:photosystem II stability/assembly factor-like uncharacterized protein